MEAPNIDKEQLKAERIARILEYVKTMKPFERTIDEDGEVHWIVPSVPIVDEESYKNIVIPNYIRCGAIPKADLIVGKTYYGDCRNAGKAIWKGDHFTYVRYKFGTYFNEDINHFEDDNGYDLFVPTELIEDE